MTTTDTRCRHANYARAIRQLRQADPARRRAEADPDPRTQAATARRYVTAWHALTDLDTATRNGDRYP